MDPFEGGDMKKANSKFLDPEEMLRN